MTVLIADDFDANRKVLNAVLAHEGFRVCEAHDGIEALQALEREPIDAVISDILMPKMDGYRLCAEVRRSERFKDVPFIFYTSTYTSPSDEALALELGADKFIRKPAPGQVIVAAVRELLSGPRRVHAAVAPRADLDLTSEYTQRLVEKLEEKNEELHRRTQELRETSEKLQAVIRAAPVAILSFDQDGRVRTWNPAAERIFGWSEAEVMERRPPHVGADSQEEFERLRQRVLGGQMIAGLEVRRYRRDGTAVELELNAAPLQDGDGNIVGKMAVLADISDRKSAEAAAVRSRDSYKALFNDFPALIWQSGTDAMCSYFNRTWLEFTGRTLNEELGDGWTQGLHPDDLEETVKSYLKAFHARQPFEIEYRLRRRDGAYRNILDSGRPLTDPDGCFAGYIGSCYDITELRQTGEALQQANEQLHILSQRLFQVQEEERRHLARELHDQVGQGLTAAKINLQGALQLDERSAVAIRVNDSIALLDELTEKVRTLSLELRPPVLDDLGLVPALRWYLDYQARVGGFHLEFFADPQLGRLGANTETACFRIVQEAVTNVLRHADADRVNVELRRTADALHLIVRDNGIGFASEADRKSTPGGTGLGMLGMRERVGLLGGEIDFRSIPGDGVELHVFLPIPSEASPGQ